MRIRILWALLGALAFVAGDLVGAFLHSGDRLDSTGSSLLLVAIVEAFGFALTFAVVLASLSLLAWVGRKRLHPRVGLKVETVGAFALLAVALSLQLTFVRDAPVVIATSGLEAVQSGSPKNVLWVVIDTLRADLLYGEDLSFPDAPAIAAMAREGVVFTQADAPSSWTIPSTAALLTGINPLALNANAAYCLTPSAHTAAEILASAGYDTRAVVDNSLLDRGNGFAQGFEGYEKRTGMEFAYRLLSWYAMPERLADRLRFALRVTYAGAEHVTDQALEVVAQERSRPLFLYVHYMDTHAPYFEHPECGARPDDIGGFDFDDREWRREIKSGAAGLTEALRRKLQYFYGGELRYVDRHLGRLLASFEERFGESETLIVLTADHGEEFFEHGDMGHGQSLYGELVHVPLVMRLPDATGAAARIVRTPVSLVDVLPTTLDVLDVVSKPKECPLPMEGRSLLPLLGASAGPADVPLFSYQKRSDRRFHRWRRGDLVLIETQVRQQPMRRELYDLGQDPLQRDDLALEDPDRTAALAAELATFLAAQESLRKNSAVTAGADARALRALGYTGNN